MVPSLPEVYKSVGVIIHGTGVPCRRGSGLSSEEQTQNLNYRSRDGNKVRICRSGITYVKLAVDDDLYVLSEIVFEVSLTDLIGAICSPRNTQYPLMLSITEQMVARKKRLFLRILRGVSSKIHTLSIKVACLAQILLAQNKKNEIKATSQP